MSYFERGDPIRIRTDAAAFVEADVVIDLGGETIIVTRKNSPRSTKRVARTQVQAVSIAEPLPPPKPEPLPEGLRMQAGTTIRTNGRSFTPSDTAVPSALHCVETSKGWCALQRQASPPTKNEMIGGAYTICSTWTSSRTSPTKREPSCPECRARLGYDGV